MDKSCIDLLIEILHLNNTYELNTEDIDEWISCDGQIQLMNIYEFLTDWFHKICNNLFLPSN